MMIMIIMFQHSMNALNYHYYRIINMMIMNIIRAAPQAALSIIIDHNDSLRHSSNCVSAFDECLKLEISTLLVIAACFNKVSLIE